MDFRTDGIVVNTDFGLPMTAIFGIAFQCFFIGMLIGGRLRRRLFSKDFMEKNFGDMHMQAFGSQITQDGYPDTGNGKYAQQLDYKDWFEFNVHQRAHYNCLEQVATMIAAILLTGVSMPLAGCIIGWVYFIGRTIYTFGYITKGPKGRLIGALICDAAIVASFVTSIISIVRVFQGSSNFA